MREEKVKGSLFQGEIEVRAHGLFLAPKPGSKRRTSGEPVKA
jgi:hypothetical protein